MGGFEPFDIRCWAEKGLTFALPQRHPVKSRIVKRPSLKTYFVSTAIAAIAFLATSDLRAEPSLSIMNWLTPVGAVNDVLEQGSVPKGYWPKLVSVLKYAPLLPEDDYSADPDPIV